MRIRQEYGMAVPGMAAGARRRMYTACTDAVCVGHGRTV